MRVRYERGASHSPEPSPGLPATRCQARSSPSNPRPTPFGVGAQARASQWLASSALSLRGAGKFTSDILESLLGGYGAPKATLTIPGEATSHPFNRSPPHADASDTTVFLPDAWPDTTPHPRAHRHRRMCCQRRAWLIAETGWSCSVRPFRRFRRASPRHGHACVRPACDSGFRQIGPRKDHREFLAADATDLGMFRSCRAQAGDEFNDHYVACRMAAFVIHVLEMVDVQDDQRQRILLRRCASASSMTARPVERRR